MANNAGLDNILGIFDRFSYVYKYGWEGNVSIAPRFSDVDVTTAHPTRTVSPFLWVGLGAAAVLLLWMVID